MAVPSTVAGDRYPGLPHPVRRSRPTVDRDAMQAAVERQRIAGRLHDEVSPLLFAITAGAQRAELHPDADLRDVLRRVAEQAAEAADRLRDVLRACAPAGPVDGVPAAADRDVQDFTCRTGVTARLRVRGAVRALAPAAERAVLAGLRLALSNVELHSRASAVEITLDYAPDQVQLVVHDDGRGLPTGFEVRALPAGDRRWGLASIARHAEQCGGALELDGVGGGTRLRVRLPG